MTVSINVGDTVAQAEANAAKFAGELYDAIPIEFAPGQAFKNAFVASFLGRSNRARKMAGEVLGYGSRKAVIAENYGIEAEEEDTCCEPETTCCHSS